MRPGRLKSRLASDIIDRLLQLDPRERLGSCWGEDNDYEKLKTHPFFDEVDFDDLKKTIIPMPTELWNQYEAALDVKRERAKIEAEYGKY